MGEGGYFNLHILILMYIKVYVGTEVHTPILNIYILILNKQIGGLRMVEKASKYGGYC
jgi:hypothetical protein